MAKDYQDDELLLARIKTGEEQALKNIFHTYWPAFRDYLLKNHRLSREEVVDIYAQTFTVFYLNVREGKFEPPLQANIKTYIIGIGKKMVLKYLTKKRKDPILVDPDSLADQNIAQLPDIVDYFELEWQRNLVKNLLGQLDEACRKLLELSFIREYADEAIKEELAVASLVAVRQRRFYCLDKLRKLVKKTKQKET